MTQDQMKISTQLEKAIRGRVGLLERCILPHQSKGRYVYDAN